MTEFQGQQVSASIIDRARFERPTIRLRTWAAVALILLGAALIVLPFAFDMFSRAPKGATMISGFRPFMSQGRLDGFQRDMKQINAGVQESKTSVARYLTNAATAPRRNAAFDARYPEFANFAKQWGAIDAHMTNLLAKVKGNLPNYQAVAALPSFNLFPWFFVVPGILVLILVGVVVTRPIRRRKARWILIALGVGLILAPAVFQMFQRAPKGGQMMSAFRTIESTSNVEKIQGYFGSMAVGQGAIQLELVPALKSTGLTDAAIDAQFPAVVTLDRHWVHILNDMTPMIGAMSDNVPNYLAVSALPPFPLFPYFFVFPGLMVAAAAIALVPGTSRERVGPRSDRQEMSTTPNSEVSQQVLQQQ